ncbi:MAG: helix-turn-helix domain-containing protein [Acidimicrobiia bacterium]|nr:helix-turn-helix domain-containing protein [Acidimicrobiia bacterium]
MASIAAARRIPTLEAADRLGIEVGDVYRMIEDGRLTASWNGHRLFVSVEQVESLANTIR